jgi:hypothetical protein
VVPKVLDEQLRNKVEIFLILMKYGLYQIEDLTIFVSSNPFS